VAILAPLERPAKYFAQFLSRKPVPEAYRVETF